MYSRPSVSQRREPFARSMISGAPPTARNARTGLFTPPTRIFSARAKRSLELVTVESYYGYRALKTKADFLQPQKAFYRAHYWRNSIMAAIDAGCPAQSRRALQQVLDA